MMTIVACNVYISEGRCHELLSELLEYALSNSKSSRVVHVFRDVRYNRSSFHFVGPVAACVAPFCVKAWDMLERRVQILNNNNVSKHHFHLRSATDHPAVGYVDHVSVLPLSRDSISSTQTAAIEIGTHLQESSSKPNVLYYGLANPNGTSLAMVRRNRTSFFRRNEVTDPMVTVGAPGIFVENYNIQLKCCHSIATTLTKRLRDQLALEALTLPYDNDNDIFEVACNVPIHENDRTQDIMEQVNQWRKEQHGNVEILQQYRVGTTAQQCRDVWNASNADYEQHLASLRSMILQDYSDTS